MLTAQNNELVTRVERGTPAGDYFRQFWLPFLMSWELEADGSPERVRIMGENLIAFRNTKGNVGLIAENCPHRGASMFFGRNENDGLACVYHGWKFAPDGNCMEMPSEPDESNYYTKVRVGSYPCVEKGGLVWTYMGPMDAPPPLPGLEWLDLPDGHVIASKRVQYSNWLQALEGEIDQSHLSFTHARLKPGEGVNQATTNTLVNTIRQTDKHPKFETIDTDYGVCIGSGRNAPDNQKYWRVSQWLTPAHIMTGPYGPNPVRNWRFWLPIDDTNVLVIGLYFHPTRPFTGEEQERFKIQAGVWSISPDMRVSKPGSAFANWHPKATLENNFFIDREMQKHENFSGIGEFWAQDAAPQLSMGPIYDRRKEHLGTSDLGIISMRKRLTKEVAAFRDSGETPPQVLNPAVYAIRSDATLLQSDEHWFTATTDRRKARPGVNPDCT